ncbi:MAG: ribosome-binding factor A [Candidatus Moranbacteria bacterium]|nr:ribosome-binding factor A [Candidatus Moranbacteria bacterium]NTW46031.1 ribosome-binding factor A [Candidatus Moranbacteria bacterium]
MSRRILQINELLRERLGEIILREVSFKPGVLATLTKVSVSRDLRHASVHISPFPETESEYVMRTLEHERKRIQKILHGGLHMKPLPAIAFLTDTTEREADIVERILRDLD